MATSKEVRYDHAGPTPHRHRGVTLQIVCDWVVRSDAEGSGGLIDSKAASHTPKLDAAGESD